MKKWVWKFIHHEINWKLRSYASKFLEQLRLLLGLCIFILSPMISWVSHAMPKELHTPHKKGGYVNDIIFTQFKSHTLYLPFQFTDGISLRYVYTTTQGMKCRDVGELTFELEGPVLPHVTWRTELNNFDLPRTTIRREVRPTIEPPRRPPTSTSLLRVRIHIPSARVSVPFRYEFTRSRYLGGCNGTEIRWSPPECAWRTDGRASAVGRERERSGKMETPIATRHEGKQNRGPHSLTFSIFFFFNFPFPCNFHLQPFEGTVGSRVWMDEDGSDVGGSWISYLTTFKRDGED